MKLPLVSVSRRETPRPKVFNLLILLALAFFWGSKNLAAQAIFEPFEQKIPDSRASMRFAPIAGGSFKMGSPAAEKGRKMDEGPQREVAVDSFWMAIFETTHDQFEPFLLHQKDSLPRPDAVTRPSPPYIDFTKGMGKHGGFPANSMSAYSALMFCRWVFEKTGVFYRLPTEAEWEFAARAGSTTAYFFDEKPKKLAEFGWFADNSDGHYQKVGLLKPNAFGLFDLLGNVAEWTLDEHRTDAFSTLNPKNPLAENPEKTTLRALRGGSFESKKEDLRSAARQKAEPVWNRRDPQIPRSRWWMTDAPFVGFRLVRPFRQPTQAEANAFFDNYLKH